MQGGAFAPTVPPVAALAIVLCSYFGGERLAGTLSGTVRAKVHEPRCCIDTDGISYTIANLAICGNSARYFLCHTILIRSTFHCTLVSLNNM